MKYFFSFLILSCGNKSNTSIEEDQSSEEHKFQEIENFLGRWPKEYFPLALIFDNQLDSLKNNLFETLFSSVLFQIDHLYKKYFLKSFSLLIK